MEIPYEVTPRRDTGLYNAKLGIWLFLASEVMLFGGLFSAYVFLRLGVQDGVDNPWPWGVSVHKSFVWLGAINTVVLIASSVGVVFAWVSLKERNWRRYQIWMYFVVACAVVFMCLKGVEYNSKLNKHHGIKLVDNSVMEGVIIGKTDRLRFHGEKMTFSLQAALPAVLRDLDSKDFPGFTVTDGPEGTVGTELKTASAFKSWFHDNRRAFSAALAEDRKRYRAELESGVANPKPVSVKGTATVTAAAPFAFHGNPRKIVSHNETTVNYRDGVKVEGKLESDDVIFEVHEVDMQLVLPQQQRESVVWDVIANDAAKQSFFTQQSQKYQELVEYYEKRGEVVPEKMLRGRLLNVHYIHVPAEGHEGGEGHVEKEKHASVHSSEVNLTAGSVGGEGEHGPSRHLVIPREQVKFMGNHGPRYGNYYAIYFTMTALHGIHVVGGALVLLFFVVFGKKLYLKNPEHLANRVEVGGLFWHFVDLIWIFLFPIMYLL
ncbi:MAG: cytochrome c oxidase subunit 3 [Verrucomicrobiales bacterium]|nr:cytochrome c oxidase subunit 3 [Verrucomicrobiales bacterium]